MSERARVWRAAADDADEVTRLLIGFRDWLGSDSPSPAAMADSVARLLADPDAEYLLGAVGGEAAAAGVCQLRFRHSAWTSREDCWLEDLFIEEAARGHGLGRALTLAACERARERGAGRIELDTSESNAAAIALYESVGFSATSKAHAELSGRDLFMGRRL